MRRAALAALARLSTCKWKDEDDAWPLLPCLQSIYTFISSEFSVWTVTLIYSVRLPPCGNLIWQFCFLITHSAVDTVLSVLISLLTGWTAVSVLPTEPPTKVSFNRAPCSPDPHWPISFTAWPRSSSVLVLDGKWNFLSCHLKSVWHPTFHGQRCHPQGH